MEGDPPSLVLVKDPETGDMVKKEDTAAFEACQEDIQITTGTLPVPPSRKSKKISLPVPEADQETKMDNQFGK